MTTITVPKKEQVSSSNQNLFNALESKLGMVPNLYATLAYSETALQSYLDLQSTKTSLSAKQKEVINLVTSQVNECEYCLAAHTALGKMHGFSDEQILEIRRGDISFDKKLNDLALFTKAVAEKRGRVDSEELEKFLAAGHTHENLIDSIVVIGDKIITNYLHNVTKVPVDFPAAKEL